MSKFKKAIFAGGCFWCMVKPFDSYDGVKSVVVGYMPTAVPKILGTSLAPSDQPKNKPELKNMKKEISMSLYIPFDGEYQ